MLNSDTLDTQAMLFQLYLTMWLHTPKPEITLQLDWSWVSLKFSHHFLIFSMSPDAQIHQLHYNFYNFTLGK